MDWFREAQDREGWKRSIEQVLSLCLEVLSIQFQRGSRLRVSVELARLLVNVARHGADPSKLTSLRSGVKSGRVLASATAFARDYWMQGKISATKDGKITGLWCHTTADHGGFDA